MLIQTAPLDPTNGWSALGIGGVLAAMMFWFYRQDRKDNERRMEQIIKDLADKVGDFRAIVEGITKSMTTLESTLRSHDQTIRANGK